MFQINGTARVLLGIGMLASIVGAWWWFTLILTIVFLFLFPVYYEILLWGIIYDALYGLPLARFGGFPYVFTVGAFVLFLATCMIRKILIIHEPTI